MSGFFWHEWEDEVLKSLYPSEGGARCVKALPHRTLRSIKARARVLKLRTADERIPWTPVELSLVKRLYPKGGAAAVIGFLPGRSVPAIKKQASVMRLFDETSAFSHPHAAAETDVPLPAPHDYAPEDHAWMATRLPVFVGGFGAAVIGRVSAWRGF